MLQSLKKSNSTLLLEKKGDDEASPSSTRLPLSPRSNIEIQLRQTALHAGWLPGSTVVNNRRVSVSWRPNQSCGCVHFNTLSASFMDFYFDTLLLPIVWEGNPPSIRVLWYFLSGDKSGAASVAGSIFQTAVFLICFCWTPQCPDLCDNMNKKMHTLQVL